LLSIRHPWYNIPKLTLRGDRGMEFRDLFMIVVDGEESHCSNESTIEICGDEVRVNCGNYEETVEPHVYYYWVNNRLFIEFHGDDIDLQIRFDDKDKQKNLIDTLKKKYGEPENYKMNEF
jgi:hypothetical protein